MTSGVVARTTGARGLAGARTLRGAIAAAPSLPPPVIAPVGSYLTMIRARAGLVGAFLYGGDVYPNIRDWSNTGLSASWTTGHPVEVDSPINDGRGTLMTSSDVGTILHNAALAWGDGPFGVELWYDGAGGSNHRILSKSNYSTQGWVIEVISALVRLCDPTDISNIRQTASAAAGMRHIAITRGTGADGKVIIDGVDVTTLSNPKTFVASLADILLEANGTVFGLNLYNREITVSECLEEAAYAAAPPPVPLPSGPFAPVGFGRDCLNGLGTSTYVVTNTNASGAGSLLSGLAALSAGTAKQVTCTPGLAGTISLPLQVNYLTGATHFSVDFTGSGILDIHGGNLWFEGCGWFLVRNVRFTGGWSGAQNADNFTITQSCHDFTVANCSFNGGYDEGCSPTANCYNYTLMDNLFGPGEGQPATALWNYNGVGNHNFGSLAYGYNQNKNGPGTYLRNVFVRKNYRNPKVAYRGDTDNGYTPAQASQLSPNAIDYHVVNNIAVKCNYGLTVENGAKCRSEGNVYQSCVETGDVSQTGGGISSYPLPSWAAVTVLSQAEAVAYAKLNAGTLPRDAFDTALISDLT